MSVLDVTMIHHVGIVLFVLYLYSSFNYSHPLVYFLSLIYLYLVHERYVMRLRRKLQFEERKQANQRKVLSDSETVRWLNYAVEKMWPICMENIASQNILLPIIPWFLEKYKPWTAKQAIVQSLYMGRSPPVFTEMRVLRQSTDDDHLVLKLGMNFLTADDMSALLAVQLRKRLGFGMWAKLHITGMHVEGKVLIGVKFLRRWPFINRLRVCFSEPPYFQMTVKPLFTHGLDVTELPGIAGWLDKLLSIAFEQTLVEPNMLVVDVEKFASQQSDWFTVDEKEPIAYARVEIIEASDMKPSDLNGLADPYLKGQLGAYTFKTKIQKKTLSPKWHEEFKIPIWTWESPSVLALEVCDKDYIVDDTLGDCTVNISDLRDGQRHDMWLSLKNIKMGRLHLAITVSEDTEKGDDKPCDDKILNQEENINTHPSESARKGTFSSISSEKSPRLADNYEPINIEGQRETGIWVHQPGSEVSQTWEPRKGKGRSLDTKIHRVSNNSFGNTSTTRFGLLDDDSSSCDENAEGKQRMNRVRRGLQKFGSLFHRTPKQDHSDNTGEGTQSPKANLREINEKGTGVKFIVEDSLSLPASSKVLKEEVIFSSEGSTPESPSKGMAKGMAQSIHAGKSARTIKHTLSNEGSRGSQGDVPMATERDIYPESESSVDESISSPRVERIPILVDQVPYQGNYSHDSKEPVVQTGLSNSEVLIIDKNEPHKS